MVDERHQRLIARLAAVLVASRDIEVLADRLCEAARQMLSSDGAAIVLLASGGSRQLVSSTDALAAQLEDLQDVVGQGPSVEAARTGQILFVPWGGQQDERWPLMHERGTDVHAGTLIAIPLTVDGAVIGNLSAHRSEPWTPADRETGTFLGVALATALLQDPSLGLDENPVAPDWPSRAQIHQATGMVVAQVGVVPEDALALLKGQAFAQDVTLIEVAEQIVQRRISFRDFTIEGD